MKLQTVLFKAVPMLLLYFFLVLSVTTSQEPPHSIDEVDDYSDSILIKHKLHRHPLPLRIFGFKPGYVNDKQIVKKLGPGVFDKEGGHGGSRFYSYPSLGIQVYYSIGADNIIDFISITSAAYPYEFFDASKANNRDRAPAGAGMKLSGSIGLGDSPGKLISKYGTPNYDYFEDGVRIIIYMDDYDVWKEVAHYEATFTFKENKLVRMSIYNGE